MAMIFLLYNRYEAKGLALVALQEFSPEKNLYSYWNQFERFRHNTYFHTHLPFFGEWHISQGHAGAITHKDDYRFAWDFDVVDETGKTYRLPGKQTTDFYCYGLPVLAPAPGYVTTLIDDVEDNEIGDVNIDQNWGNTLVIKHGEYLYSKISHIKQGSFKVKVGDYVTTGDTLAFCGNSGRSPEPHLHFQLQAAPHVGAKTLSYPICYYISKEIDGFTFHSFEIPTEKQIVIRPITSKLLRQAFHFIPGMKLKFNEDNQGQKILHEWEVFVDAFNQPYLYCATTQSSAYFVNNGTLHYFTSFYGDRTSLLFLFYLGAYKVLLGYYPSLEINDTFPVEGFYSGIVKYAQDFIAPFKRFLKAAYSSSYLDANDLQDPTQLVLKASARVTVGNRIKRQIDFSFQMEREQITGFTVIENNVCIEAKRLA
jgi:murein DD-endopeptidase MepM/ murein hydrolase activator NlpD